MANLARHVKTETVVSRAMIAQSDQNAAKKMTDDPRVAKALSTLNIPSRALKVVRQNQPSEKMPKKPQLAKTLGAVHPLQL